LEEVQVIVNIFIDSFYGPRSPVLNIFILYSLNILRLVLCDSSTLTLKWIENLLKNLAVDVTGMLI
jgi:hypothetical protein